MAIAVGFVGWRSGQVIVANAVTVWLLFWYASTVASANRRLDTVAGRLGLYLGAVSFPLYIIHYPVARLLLIAVDALAPDQRSLFLIIWLPATIGFSYIAASLLHSHLEVPGTRHGKRIAERREERVGSTSSFENKCVTLRV